MDIPADNGVIQVVESIVELPERTVPEQVLQSSGYIPNQPNLKVL